MADVILSEEERADCSVMFEILDKDGSGHISTVELGTLLRGLGQNPTEDDLKKAIKDLDKDDSGTIDFEEFVKFWQSNKTDRSTEEERIKEAFKIFDKDGSGYITASELRHIMIAIGEQLSEEEADEMIKDADVNGDGRVDYQEFAKMMCWN